MVAGVNRMTWNPREHSTRVLIKRASTLLTNYVSQFQDDLSTELCSIE